MTELPDPALAQIADTLRAAGYEACIEEVCIQSEFDGVPCVLTFEHPKLSFYCFVAQDGIDIDLASLNALNRDLQFAKFALDDEENLIMAADFIVDPAEATARMQLELAVSVWTAALDELRHFIALETGSADRRAA